MPILRTVLLSIFVTLPASAADYDLVIRNGRVIDGTGNPWSRGDVAVRGQLRAGAFADVTIFNAETVIDKSTYADPFQYGEGIEFVVVNGRLTLGKGKPTDARPGVVLRHGR